MSDFTAASPQGAPVADAGGTPDIAVLIQQASDPALPISGRNAILAKIEAYHQGDAATGDQPASTQLERDTAEALAPPASPSGYHLEGDLPVGVTVENDAALETLKVSLHEFGVPASVASGEFAEIGRLHAEGAFASDASYDAACLPGRTQSDAPRPQ